VSRHTVAFFDSKLSTMFWTSNTWQTPLSCVFSRCLAKWSNETTTHLQSVRICHVYSPTHDSVLTMCAFLCPELAWTGILWAAVAVLGLCRVSLWCHCLPSWTPLFAMCLRPLPCGMFAVRPVCHVSRPEYLGSVAICLSKRLSGARVVATWSLTLCTHTTKNILTSFLCVYRWQIDRFCYFLIFLFPCSLNQFAYIWFPINPNNIKSSICMHIKSSSTRTIQHSTISMHR
jgi:hypothetical protein